MIIFTSDEIIIRSGMKRDCVNLQGPSGGASPLDEAEEPIGRPDGPLQDRVDPRQCLADDPETGEQCTEPRFHSCPHSWQRM